MAPQLENLLHALHHMKPIGADQVRTKLEGWITRLTWWLRISALSLFVILGGIAFWVSYVAPLHGIWREIALGSGLIGIVLALLILVLDTVPTIVTICNFRDDALRRFQLEIQYDLTHVAELTYFPKGILERAQQWLGIKIERIRSKIGIFFGGADKIALFALAGIGWAVWKEFPADVTSSKHGLFVVGVALMGGIAIGGVLLNAVMQRYVYHQELLTLALDCQSKNECLPRFYTVPKPTIKIRLARLWQQA